MTSNLFHLNYSGCKVRQLHHCITIPPEAKSLDFFIGPWLSNLKKCSGKAHQSPLGISSWNLGKWKPSPLKIFERLILNPELLLPNVFKMIFHFKTIKWPSSFAAFHCCSSAGAPPQPRISLVIFLQSESETGPLTTGRGGQVRQELLASHSKSYNTHFLNWVSYKNSHLSSASFNSKWKCFDNLKGMVQRVSQGLPPRTLALRTPTPNSFSRLDPSLERHLTILCQSRFSNQEAAPPFFGPRRRPWEDSTGSFLWNLATFAKWHWGSSYWQSLKYFLAPKNDLCSYQCSQFS